jgi:hypothetical protein
MGQQAGNDGDVVDISLSIADLSGEAEPEEYMPPENLAMVCKGVYRSALPKKKNFPYLKRMGLKSILCLFQVCSAHPGTRIY